jgi:putative transposase
MRAAGCYPHRMPRIARAAPGGYVYHVLNRGVGRMRLFAGPRDYEAFQKILAETLAKTPLRLCAFAIMPNHWHFVVWPEEDGQLAAFFQRLTVTHAVRWQRSRRRVGYGHVYQGRFKSFPVEADEHFYQLVRYVERNPLRANLVTEAAAWRWSSLWVRESGSADERRWLSTWPLPRPRDWLAHVNQPQSEAELFAVRRSIARGAPLGDPDWVQQTAARLGLESTLRPRGRPKLERA